MPIPPTDLSQRPPRSPRVRLGGYAILPRLLDKGRATLAGRNGEYQYACPLDQRLLEFAGIDAEALKQELAAGKSDGEILEWILANQKIRQTDAAIASWSMHQEQRAPANPESREFFDRIHRKIAPKRDDIATWFDLLDLDDFVSFGGRA